MRSDLLQDALVSEEVINEACKAHAHALHTLLVLQHISNMHRPSSYTARSRPVPARPISEGTGLRPARFARALPEFKKKINLKKN